MERIAVSVTLPVMTFIPTDSGFMLLEDSARLLRDIFPNYPELQPVCPCPVLEPQPAPRS